MKRISSEINFHDSALVHIELSNRLDTITVVLYAPNAERLGTRGGFYELTFDAVLRFEFESLDIGELKTPPEIYEVYIKEGDELERWRERMSVLAEPDSFGNQTVSGKGYTKVFHVVLASPYFEGWGKNEHLDGIWIICRSVDIRDVTSEWPDEDRVEPEIIPAARPRQRTRSTSPRRSRRRNPPHG